ncbi:Fur family transcriptional regulator [uncultured Oscillibacter sp.]|uniref:Fur family transcriptional regulator n=1 Tax=uncultured Oscillibacter sp. TaxID=876091 RepID=UPI0025CFE624|nr:transcriptional repressor [uncultured Oscillibacter sp.]
MAYSTKQQQAILNCLEARRSTPMSAADLAAELRRLGEPVGLATVYRQTEKLAAMGRVHKINTEEGAYFQYCTHHSGEEKQDCLLLKCESCGRIAHLDCTHLQPLYRHLQKEHHFVVDHRRTLFTGLCEACAEKEQVHGEK